MQGRIIAHTFIDGNISLDLTLDCDVERSIDLLVGLRY